MKNIDIKYWIWFSRIENITSLQKQKLLKKFKSPEKIWRLDQQKLTEIEWMNKVCVDEILNKKYRVNLNEYEEYMNKNNICIITILDEDYPDKLRNIYDPPVLLFVKGNLELLHKTGLAIVGCRSCSEYGKSVTQKLSYDLAKRDLCIISGLAIGIDKYAHIGALRAHGKTIAVIGNGIDNIYPYENRSLADKIIEYNGLIVSEYIIGTKPNKMNFPARNRIISGLSDGVVVVEAKKKSGSLITADFALEQGKDVYAVPGNVNNVNSEGTNDLIKEGACMVTNYKDIIRL